MHPLLPRKIDEELESLCWDVDKTSYSLGRVLSPHVRISIAKYFRILNSYYTNAMEGNTSKIRDIEAALKKDFAKNKIDRNYQLEHLAHIETQNEMIELLNKKEDFSICSIEFLTWLHKSFYEKLPEDLRFAQTVSGKKIEVIPGHLRITGASVGLHHAPETTDDIVKCLKDFESLDPLKLDKKWKFIGLASSHHRLLWIHPFPDGNGRVARLFTDAYAQRIGIEANHLWTVTRYFARNRNEYDAMLAQADRQRRNDLDGRGPLSEEDLIQFCKFFLTGCLDQIRYMEQILSPISFLKPRFQLFLESKVKEHDLSKASAQVLERILSDGIVSRNDVQKICSVKSRRATQIIKEVLDSGYAETASKYGSLVLKLNSEMAQFLFPNLV